jgi:hypothetical protein
MSPRDERARQLIWIPIVHSGPDLGSVADALRRWYVERASPEEWAQHIQTVDGAWEHVRQAIDRMHLDYTIVRLYQDGLPQCGHELDIVKDLAASGSQNHRILLDLVARGATLVGTEAPALLLEEYELVQRALARLATEDADDRAEHHQVLSQLVLEKRDRFIAGRVDETLQAGEVGLMFLGLLHALERFLPPDIQMSREAWWAATDA